MKKKAREKFSLSALVLLVFLLFYSVSLIFLYLWGFMSSAKTTDQFMQNMVGLPDGWPWQWTWSNYKKALDLFNAPILTDGNFYVATFGDMFFNSVVYSLTGPLISVTTTWLMAYLCAQFPGRASRFIYRANIVIMTIPIVGSLPSALQIYGILNLYDNWGYVAVSSVVFIGANYLIFYAVLGGVSVELKEAAQLDGAGNFTVMARIFFPLTFTMYGILFLTAFIARWNDYMTMIIWLPSKPSLSYGMYRFSTSVATGASWPPIQIAGCMIVMLPILIIFLIFKNKIIGRVTIGAFR